jgi:hypothetical protein
VEKKFHLYHHEKFEKNIFEIWNEKFCFWNLKTNWPYHHREMKILNFHFWNLKWKFLFWTLKRIAHTTREKWKNSSFVPSRKFWYEKISGKSFLKFEMKILILEIWNFFCHTTRGKWQNLKERNHIFRLRHHEKTTNNTLYYLYISTYTTC